MEVILLVVAIGVIGGAAAAAVTMAIAFHRRDAIAALAARRQPMDSPAINYSSMKVSGVGGLGLVVVCATIAIALPQVRQTILTGFGLGVLLAVALVLWRRRAPLPSSGAKPGANTTLAIDGDGEPKDSGSPKRPGLPSARQVITLPPMV